MPTSLQLEKWGPMMLSVGAAGTWWWFDGTISAVFAKELFAALLSAASVAAGFLTAALSILLPIASTATGLKLRRSGYQQELFRYMRAAIYGCLFLAALSVVAFFGLAEDGTPNNRVSTVLVFATVYSGLCLIRVAEILMALFERASEPDDRS
jgi:hypothetical protein